MYQKLLSIIGSSPALTAALRILGWSAAIIAILVTTVMMKTQEISFIYNAF